MKLIFKGGLKLDYDLDVYEIKLLQKQVFVINHGKRDSLDEKERKYSLFEAGTIEYCVPYEFLEGIEL